MTETAGTTSARPRRIAVDFDGVIHPMTTPWTGPLDIHDPPFPGALSWLRKLLTEGWVVILHTCRLMHSVPEKDTAVPEIDLDERLAALDAWFRAHRGSDIVEHPGWRWWTHGGKPWADVYADDKALRVEGGRFPAVAVVLGPPPPPDGVSVVYDLDFSEADVGRLAAQAARAIRRWHDEPDYEERRRRARLRDSTIQKLVSDGLVLQLPPECVRRDRPEGPLGMWFRVECETCGVVVHPCTSSVGTAWRLHVERTKATSPRITP